MKITILTLFPEMFDGPFEHSIIKRAKLNSFVEIKLINIRDFGVGKHKVVDDAQYGGGVGMVLKVDVLHAAISAAKIDTASVSQQNQSNPPKRQKSEIKEKIVLLSATGKTYNQKIANKYSKLDHLILICGHYEGVDERVKSYIDEEISIGDFILTGGEIPAMLIADSITRLIPGVLPDNATEDESFSKIDNQTLLEYPHYANPREYDNQKVPDVLLSGNHKKIKDWRMDSAQKLTTLLRPDLLKKRGGRT